jgi:osmotically inducible protein OsmC
MLHTVKDLHDLTLGAADGEIGEVKDDYIDDERWATRKAHARWEGSNKDGRRQVDLVNGAFKSVYSFNSRFEDGRVQILKNCLPRPMRAPSQWRCRSYWGVQEASLITSMPLARVMILPQDAATFARHAEAAKAGCPVSQALAGATITLEDKLSP